MFVLIFHKGMQAEYVPNVFFKKQPRFFYRVVSCRKPVAICVAETKSFCSNSFKNLF